MKYSKIDLQVEDIMWVNMTYDNLYYEFKNLFPECNSTFEEYARKANADEDDGMHIMFSFVVIPFVIQLIKEKDDDKLKRAFDYFEKMASSNISDITEVLEFTVIENLLSNGQEIYECSQKYMGDEMLACCKMVEQYLKT